MIILGITPWIIAILYRQRDRDNYEDESPVITALFWLVVIVAFAISAFGLCRVLR